MNITKYLSTIFLKNICERLLLDEMKNLIPQSMLRKAQLTTLVKEIKRNFQDIPCDSLDWFLYVEQLGYCQEELRETLW